MNARNHSSFPVFELAIVAALVLIGWAAYRLYKIVPEVEESRREPAELRDEFYEVGDFVQTNITELNEALGNYLQGKNPQDLKRFEAGSRRWDNWMNEKRRVWLDEERQIWSEMEAQPTTTN